MDDADGYFEERVAAIYDESSADMFDPAVVQAVADVLAGLADGDRAGYPVPPKPIGRRV